MSQNIFNSVLINRPVYNRINMSHDHKLSLDMGQLIPVMNMECIPGDSITLGAEFMLRMAPMLAPIMHRVNVDVHYWFVPYRLVWDGWEDFWTNPDSVDAPAVPYFPGAVVNQNDLSDYLGLPLTDGDSTLPPVSSFAHASYQLVYNDRYRGQQTNPEVTWKLVDGANDYGTFNQIRYRAWEHDYFTSMLPTPQAGQPVSIPLGEFTDVPVVTGPGSKLGQWRKQDGSTFGVGFDGEVHGTNPAITAVPYANVTVDAKNAYYDPNGSLVAQTSALELEAATINNLRRAFAVQRVKETDIQGGQRYEENVLAHYGVKMSDSRIQRPEFIGGATGNVIISEVLQTSETLGSDGTPQGNMAGHGIAAHSSGKFHYFVREHGILMAIASVRPKTAYFQGIHRSFLKFDRYDYFLPALAHIGEQAVKGKELFVTHDPLYDEKDIGYNPRYSEYYFANSRVSGDFRTSLDFWHLARKFAPGDRPELNQQFIDCKPDKRIFAVQSPTIQSLWMHAYLYVSAKRLVPKFPKPI